MAKKKYPAHGILNDIEIPKIGLYADMQDASVPNLIKSVAEEAYTPDAISNTGPYKAIVLRVDQGKDPTVNSWVAEMMKTLFGTAVKTQLIEVYARIPEIHSMLPIPKNIGDQSDEQHIIEMYPRFISQNDQMPTPEVGSVVWVDFGNKNDFSDPIYLGPVLQAKSTPVAAGDVNPKKVVRSACAGTFNSKAPTGDGFSGKNKNLKNTGLPLTNRKPSSTVKDDKIITGERASQLTIRRWRAALKSNNLIGVSWIGNIRSNGASDPLHAEGKRDTIIFAPDTTDFTKPVELIYWVHGLGEFAERDFTNRLAPSAKQLSKERRNYILVIQEMPWSKQIVKPEGAKPYRKLLHQRRVFQGSDNWAQTHNEVLLKLKQSFSNNVNVGFITIVAHSAGGAALRTAAVKGYFNNIKPNKITFSDGDYGGQAKVVWDKYVKNNSNVEFNLLTQPKSYPSRQAKKLLSQVEASGKSRINWKVLKGLGHRGIGNKALLYNGSVPPVPKPTEIKSAPDVKAPKEKSEIKVKGSIAPSENSAAPKTACVSSNQKYQDTTAAATAAGINKLTDEAKKKIEENIKKYKTPGFKQYAEPWRKLQYGSKCKGSTFRSSACGATALADVLAAYGENTNPYLIAQEIDSVGLRICGAGTSGAAMIRIPKAHGKNAKQATFNSAKAALKEGKLVIAHSSGRFSRKKGKYPDYFTRHGHYIVLRDIVGNKINVNDVGSSRSARNGLLDEEIIETTCNLYWVVEP